MIQIKHQKQIGILLVLFLMLLFIHKAFSQSFQDTLLQQLNSNAIGGLEDAFGSNPLSIEIDPKFEKNVIINSLNSYLENLTTSTALEQSFSKRIDRELKLIGYEFLQSRFLTALNEQDNTQGGLQKDHILSVGDEVILVLQGEKNTIIRQKVTRSGLLIFDFTEPFTAVGRSLAEVKEDIDERVSSAFLETKSFLSLGELSQIGVTIAGEVNAPGKYNLSGLSNLIDAILVGGGVKKTGSLRNIKVKNIGSEKTVDLYPLIFGSTNSFSNTKLLNNTIIFVPPIGSTVALTGNINKPGIYELKENRGNPLEHVNFAGGFLSSFNNSFSINRMGKKGKSTKLVNNLNKASLTNGDILNIVESIDSSQQSSKLIGAVKFPGYYSIKENPKLSQILPNSSFLNQDSFKLSIVIKTINNETLENVFIVKNLLNILKGKEDYYLRPNDEIFVLSWKDLKFITSDNFIHSILRGNKISKKTECTSIKALKKHISSLGTNGLNQFSSIFDFLEQVDTSNYFAGKNLLTVFSESEEQSGNKKLGNLLIPKEKKQETNKECPIIFDNELKLLPSILSNLVVVRGKLKNPGVYVAEDEVNPKTVLAYAGVKGEKFKISLDRKIITVLSQTVSITGLENHPIELDLKKETQLSEILSNPSQLENGIYPLFSLITRKNESSGVSSHIIFSPEAIFNRRNDVKIKPYDTIRFFKENEINQITKQFSLNGSENEIENNSKTEVKSNNIQEEANEKKQDLAEGEEAIVKSDSMIKILSSLSEKDKNLAQEFLSKSEFGEKSNLVNSTQNNNQTSNGNVINNLDLVKNVKEELSLNDQNKLDKILNIIKMHSVHITGEVIAPGYYPIGDITPVTELINLTGGMLFDTSEKLIEVSGNDGKKQVDGFVRPGSKIIVLPSYSEKKDILLTGEFEKPRSVQFTKNIELYEIINRSEEFTENAYLHFAVIKRKARNKNINTFIPFSPLKVITKSQNSILEESDEIIIYSKIEINEMLDKFSDGNEQSNPEVPSLSLNYKGNGSGSLKDVVRENIVRVHGEVGEPGKILVGGNFSLKELLELSGGLTSLAEINEIQLLFPKKNENNDYELISKLIDLNKINWNEEIVVSGSIIRVSSIVSSLALGSIIVEGALDQPGTFQILPDETLYDIIIRSGGLKNDAFLDGMIFSRLEEKKREQDSVERLRRELEKSIATAIESRSTEIKVDPENIMSLRALSLAASEFKAVGRVVGNYNSVEKLRSIKIKNGDRIVIPHKPTSVTIVGETMAPGSVLWDPKTNVDGYIEKTAGFTQLADTSKVFVIQPNGQAQRKGGLWSNSINILPGTTIVVPRKIEFTNTLGKISAVTSVVYQLTLALAGIDNLLLD